MNRPFSLPMWVLALFCACWPGSAEASGPYGGSVASLVLAADGETPAWAATDRGLFRYRAGSWARVESLSQRDLRVVLDLGSALLVVESRRGVLRSEDGGESWGESTSGLRGRYGHRAEDVTALVRDPNDPGHLYLGAAGQGPFESRDGGRTWHLLLEGLEDQPPPAFYPSALLPPAEGRPLLMGTEGRGLLAREGNVWKPFGEGLPEGLRVQALAASPAVPLHVAMATRGAGLWESRDGGRTWKALRRGAYGIAGAVAVSASGVVLAHFPEEGLVVCEGGKASRPGGLKEAQVQTLVSRKRGGWLAGLAYDGLQELTESGGTGAVMNAGLDATQILSLISGQEPGSLWAGDRNGVFYSPDDGVTWEARDAGLLGAAANVLLWSGGQLYLGTAGQGVFRWDETSHSWAPRSGGLGTANTIFSLQSGADDELFVGTEGGVLASGDGGGLWERRNEGLPGAAVWHVAADPGEPGIVWAAGGGHLYRSADGGRSWEPLADANPLALAMGSGTLWVLESSRVTTLDAAGPGGVKTAFETSGGGEQVRCIALDQGAPWFGTTKGLWTPAGGSPPQKVWNQAGVLSLLPSPDGRLLAGTDGRGVLRFRLR